MKIMCKQSAFQKNFDGLMRGHLKIMPNIKGASSNMNKKFFSVVHMMIAKLKFLQEVILKKRIGVTYC